MHPFLVSGDFHERGLAVFLLCLFSGVDTKLGVYSLSKFTETKHRLISPFPHVSFVHLNPIFLVCSLDSRSIKQGGREQHLMRTSFRKYFVEAKNSETISVSE